MLKFKSIRTEITLYIVSSLAVILLVVSGVYINKVAKDSKQAAELGLTNALTVQSEHIIAFFSKHAAVVETVLANPHLTDWFNNYRQRDADLSTDKSFPQIVSLFKNLSKDPETKAVFFASGLTGEYFDNSNGRYGKDNYDARKRPWWGKAKQQDRMFVTQPEQDFVDKTIVTSIKRTVYNDQQELIGVAGVDILISTIEQKVKKELKYKGVGEAFLINSDGRIILFPSDNQAIKVDSLFGNVDTALADSSGFRELYNQIQRVDTGVSDITWKGKRNIVAYHRISSEEPYLDWVAGIIVPASIVDDPINQSTWNAVLATLIVLVVVTLLVFAIAQRIVTPLNKLVAAIKEVAEGDNDLTKRLEVSNSNEVSQFSQQFNLFVEHIQEIMLQNKQAVEDLHDDADHISAITSLTRQQAGEQKDATDLVATAAEELSYSVKDISKNTASASSSASEAEEQIIKGVEIVAEASGSINTLANTVEKIASVVDVLNQDSTKIGGVLEVIQGIAEQTNLLALNAAIEAARAGDQGRGFAVVADEVRTLASRTQESTQVIEQIIGSLQDNANKAAVSMETGKSQAIVGVERSQMVQSVLDHISTSITDIQKQSIQISDATHEQAKAAQEITERATSIRELSEKTEQQINQVQDGTKKQREGIHRLSELVAKFKI